MSAILQQTSCLKCGSPGRHLKTRSRRARDGLRAVLVACIPCGKAAGVVWTEHRAPACGPVGPLPVFVKCSCVVGGPEGPCELHGGRPSAPSKPECPDICFPCGKPYLMSRGKQCGCRP